MSTFRQTLEQKRLAISAELTLKRDSRESDIQRQAESIGPLVDAFQVSDIPYGWIQMSALSAAALLKRHGCDPVPLLICRDRRARALRSDLLGFRALGVDSVFLMRGHRLPDTHPVPSLPVHDLTAQELIEMAAELSAQGPEGDFLIGVGARAFRPVRGWAGESLGKRIDAGAGFVQTQLCMNLNLLQHYMRRLNETGIPSRVPVIVTVSPLPSAETALWMRTHMKDCRIPDPIIEKLEKSNDPQRRGVKICANLMRKIAAIEGVAGINVMTTGNPDAIRETIVRSGLREV